ncbi:MAG: hypothetical protein WCH86_07225 [Kiritimatiellales bacterium]
MLKKLVLLTAVALSVLSLPAQAFWGSDDITMLVMPREVTPLQIAQDISRRYPVMIVSYQLTQGVLKIHAWNGDSWVAVSVEDYASGTFFASRPKRAIVVENEKFSAPATVIPNSMWCESATRIASTDPRTLLHLLGLSFDFSFRDWNQFAKRYGFELEQINPTLENVHWWNLRGDVLVEKRAQRNFSIDLDKWHYLETLPPPVIVPVVIETAAPVAAPAAPKKTETGATAVDITAKAPEAPVEKTPDVKPAAPVVEPVKALEPVKKATEPAPIAEPAAPTQTVEPLPSLKPEPVIVPAPLVEIEPAVEAAPEMKPAAAVEADPFSTTEIPAAEIVVPQEPKKSWWKF